MERKICLYQFHPETFLGPCNVCEVLRHHPDWPLLERHLATCAFLKCSYHDCEKEYEKGKLSVEERLLRIHLLEEERFIEGSKEVLEFIS